MSTDEIIYNITINSGEDYYIDFSYTDDNETPVSMRGWLVESQLREFAESHDGTDFYCTSDETGVHLFLSHTQTGALGYTHGKYDVFITDPDNNIRVKLVSGEALIMPRSTR